MGVSKRLAAFEKVIEEVRPYLRERRLCHEDAYDIQRRMLSEAFRKAIGDDVLKLDVEMEENLRSAEGFDTDGERGLRRSLQEGNGHQNILQTPAEGEQGNPQNEDDLNSSEENPPVVFHRVTHNYELSLPHEQIYDAKELKEKENSKPSKGKDYRASAHIQHVPKEKSSWRDWLISHPDIYLYATKKKVSSPDALLGLPMNMHFSKMNKSSLNANDYEEDERSWNRSKLRDGKKIGRHSKEESRRPEVDLKDQLGRESLSRWDSKGKSESKDQYDLDYGGMDSDDYNDAGDVELSSQNKPFDRAHYDYRSDNRLLDETKAKAKRGPVWNNWPLSNPDTYNYNYKSKNDYKAHKYTGTDPFIMESIIPENSAFDVPPNVPQSIRMDEVSHFRSNEMAHHFNSDYSSSDLPDSQNDIRDDNAYTNDQINPNPNDLSHEANYKLSKLEQDDAAEKRKNKFWYTYNSRNNNKGLHRRWEKSHKI